MTKEKIRAILKRLVYYLQVVRDGKTKESFYINRKTEWIVVDYETRVVLEVLGDVAEREEPTSWFAYVIKKFKEGEKDITILMKVPVSKGKYYTAKDEFVNKIYEGCIFKGIVSYEQILERKID